MRKGLKKQKKERGQGLTEYVLILAFIAGIAFVMFGGNGSLKDTLVSTVTETNRLLSGLFGEKTYAEYFHEWKDKSSQELSKIDKKERLKVDQEALALLARAFIGKPAYGTEEVKGVNDLISELSKNKNGDPQFNNMDNFMPGDDGWSETLVPLSYTANGLDNDNNKYIHLDFNGNADTVKLLTNEVESYHGYNSGNPENNHYDSKKAVVGDRIFYSDGMINTGNNSADNKMVTLQLHYTDGVVDQVNIQARNMNPAPGDNYSKKNNNKDKYPIVEGLNLNVTKTEINQR